jgi:hypothetical protein
MELENEQLKCLKSNAIKTQIDSSLYNLKLLLC